LLCAEEQWCIRAGYLHGVSKQQYGMDTNGGGIGMDAHVREMWQHIHTGLRAFIAKRIVNEAEVDDIVQDVWLKMQRGLDGLKDQSRLIS
jgi:hypothetical protein